MRLAVNGKALPRLDLQESKTGQTVCQTEKADHTGVKVMDSEGLGNDARA